MYLRRGRACEAGELARARRAVKSELMNDDEHGDKATTHARRVERVEKSPQTRYSDSPMRMRYGGRRAERAGAARFS